MDLVRVIEILHEEIDELTSKFKFGVHSKKYHDQIQVVTRIKDKIVEEMSK